MTELVREGAVGAVRRVRWETLRSQPAVAAGEKGNWRVDPAQSGGGILVDHGWHALYVLRAVARRLAADACRPGSKPASTASSAIEDTATVRLDWNGAECEVFLTWAAPERRNRVTIEGERGRLSLDGGRLALAGGEASQRPWDLPSIAEGSHHPEWFRGVVEEFLGEVGEPARARPEFRGGRALRDAPRPGPGVEPSGRPRRLAVPSR